MLTYYCFNRLQKATRQLALVIMLIFGGVVLFLAKGTGGDPIDGFGFLLVMASAMHHPTLQYYNATCLHALLHPSPS